MIASSLLLFGALAAASQPPEGKPPVVVELFQSQGCSSCPPADAVLNDLANRPDVIALNFAVTYWDYLGWKDSFAQPAFTERQRDYAGTSGRDNVSTPQMILNGRTAIVGGRRAEVEAAVARVRKTDGGPVIRVNGDIVEIGMGKAVRPATLWLIRYDPRSIAVPIRSGENGGRTIVHRNIVRQMMVLGSWSGRATRYVLPAGNRTYKTALILQSGRGGPIISARKV